MPLSTNLPTSFADGSLTGTSRMEFTYLAVYFAFNLGLTLFNKAVMGKFPFPYLLTAIHTGCSPLGCVLLHKLGHFTLTNLTSREHAKLYLFSMLYTLNVAISNLSLHHVTIPFHQVIRATTPIFTILIYRLVYSTSYATTTHTSLLPIILGVAIATYGDYSFTLPGLFLTLLGALLAALKTVATNRMQTGGLRLGALEILHRMSALAMVQSVALAYMSGETASFLASYASAEQLLSRRRVLALLGNGAIAFGLNVVSFAANKRVGALTMTVAANVKQTLTVVLGFVLFDVRIEALNAAGIALTLAGGAWYAKVEMVAKRQTQLLPTSADVSGKA
ncbi:triose-phosphate transporter family-domain-containing protein [Cryomyces antarcticus]